MKKTNRILAFALAAVMLMCSLSLSAFAKEDTLNYLLLGDSIAFGAGVKNHDSACFGRIVADTNGYNYENLARNGSTTKDLIKRLGDADAKAAVENADIISLSIGGNNFLLANLPLLLIGALFGNFSEVDKIVDSFYVDFCDIISTIKSLNSDVVIVLQTIYNPMPGALRPVFQAALDKMNNAYKKYLAENEGSVIIADVATAMGQDLDLIALDFIHPSAQGNVVIARVLLGVLNSNGLGEATEPKIIEAGVDMGSALARKVVIGFAKLL